MLADFIARFNAAYIVDKAGTSQQVDFRDHLGNSLLTGETTPVMVAPTVTTQPSITGNVTTGSVLTVNIGAASGTPAPTGAIQWLRGTTAISGATSATYTLVSGDVGQAISARVTWTNSAGSVQATSNAITGQAAATLESMADLYWGPASAITGADTDVTGLTLTGPAGPISLTATGTTPLITRDTSGLLFGQTRYLRNTSIGPAQYGGMWAVITFTLDAQTSSTGAAQAIFALDNNKSSSPALYVQARSNFDIFLNDTTNIIEKGVAGTEITIAVEVDADSHTLRWINSAGVVTEVPAQQPTGLLALDSVRLGQMFGKIRAVAGGLRLPGQAFAHNVDAAWEVASGKKLAGV